MSRKRLRLAHSVTHEIRERTKRGESARTIHYAVRGAPSESTIERMQRDLRKKPVKPSAKRSASPIPDELPVDESTPKKDLNDWLRMFDRAGIEAVKRNDLMLLASLGQKVGQIIALQLRLAPPADPEPFEQIDYEKTAAEAEEKLFEFARSIFETEDNK